MSDRKSWTPGRLLRLFALLCIGAFAGVALSVLALFLWLQPETNGLTPSQFQDGQPVSAGSVIAESTGEAPRPNIVVILADDLGYGDIGAFGGNVIETPNIDRIATEGARFSNAYSSAALCSPSRAGLLTGRYPLRSGIITAMQMADDGAARKASYQAGILFANFASVDMLGGTNAVTGLPQSEITIPEALGVAGYRSMAIGKWHLGDFTEWPEYHPFNHGFDEFVGFNGSNDDFPVSFWKGDQEIVADIGADQARYTGLFSNEAVEFIGRQKETPFFLYLSHKDPHLPFFPSAEFAGKSPGGPYGDAVSELDASVGAVISALQANEIAENTLVIFTSDNGPWFDGSPAQFRGRKGQSYEGGFRVPMIAWWPDTIGPAQVIDAPVMSIDLLPTFLSLAGLELPSDRITDGTNLSGLFDESLGAKPKLDERSLFFFHDYDVEAIRRGEWKLYASTSHYAWPIPLDKPASFFGKTAGVRDYHPADSAKPIPTLGTYPNLYNLERDPGEAYNLTKKHPVQTAELETALAQWRDAFYANPRGWQRSDNYSSTTQGDQR